MRTNKQIEERERFMRWYLTVRDTPKWKVHHAEVLARWRKRTHYNERSLGYAKQYAVKHPEAIIAHNAVTHARERGEIIRPKRCEECHKIPRRGRDGRTQIQAHHHNGYENLLDVRWLCRACHGKLSRKH